MKLLLAKLALWITSVLLPRLWAVSSQVWRDAVYVVEHQDTDKDTSPEMKQAKAEGILESNHGLIPPVAHRVVQLAYLWVRTRDFVNGYHS